MFAVSECELRFVPHLKGDSVQEVRCRELTCRGIGNCSVSVTVRVNINVSRRDFGFVTTRSVHTYLVAIHHVCPWSVLISMLTASGSGESPCHVHLGVRPQISLDSVGEIGVERKR